MDIAPTGGMSGGSNDPKQEELLLRMRNNSKKAAAAGGGGSQMMFRDSASFRQKMPGGVLQPVRRQLTGIETAEKTYFQQQDDYFLEEEDTKSIYSNKLSLLNNNPVFIPEKERTRRKQVWHDIVYEGKKTQEEIAVEEDEFLQKNREYLEMDWGNYDYSRLILETKRGSYIPYYATNVNLLFFYGEAVLTLGEKYFEWRPESPQECFGSDTAWSQGTKVPTLDHKGGKLSNVYLINMMFNYIHSLCPYSLGVVLGERSGNTFIPYTGKLYYCNSKYSSDSSLVGDSFHFIIPAYFNSPQQAVIYRSTNQVNSEYGREYNYLTENESDIRRGSETRGSDWMIKKRSPIAKACYHDLDLALEDLPEPSKDEDKKNYLNVKNSVFRAAIKFLKEKVKNELPVHDLDKFCIRFYPLVNGPVSSVLYQKDNFQRDVESEGFLTCNAVPGSFLNTGSKEEKVNKVKQIKQTHGVMFSMESTIMFRDQASASMELIAEEQQLEEELFSVEGGG